MISSLKYLLPFFIWIMSIIFNDAVAAFFPYGVFIREFLCSIFAFVILIFNKNKKDIVLFFALIPFSIQSYAFDINNFYIFFSLTIIVSLTIRMIRDKEYIKFKPFNLILCFIPIACLISQLVNCMYTNLWINVSYILLCISYIYLILYFASYIKFNLLTDNIYFIIISITLIGQSLIMNTFYSIVPYCVPILYCLTALMIVSLKTNNPNNRYISYMGIFINFVYCICKMKYYIDFVFLGILLIYLIAYILINKINKKESIAFISSMLLTGLILWSIFSTKTYEMNKYSLTNIKDSFSIFWLASNENNREHILIMNDAISYHLIFNGLYGLILFAVFLLYKYFKHRNYNIILIFIFIDCISLFYSNIYIFEIIFIPLMLYFISDNMDIDSVQTTLLPEWFGAFLGSFFIKIIYLIFISIYRDISFD